jgi:cytochrome c oxidase subunit 3
MAFTALQVVEYIGSWLLVRRLDLRFGLLHGHGLPRRHVVIGTIMLMVCLFRLMAGGMKPEKHLGFEFAAWYWHFVDVVWLFLFAFVYVAPHIVWGPGAPGVGH